MVQGTFWLGPRLAIDLLDAAWIFSYGALVLNVTSHAQPRSAGVKATKVMTLQRVVPNVYAFSCWSD